MDDKKNMNKESGLINALKDVSRHFEKISGAIHQFSEVYKENTHKLPYLKTKECWSLFLILSSLIGAFISLYFMGEDALSLVKAYSIRTEMAQIEKFKVHENKAVDTARILIINQTIDCPVQEISKLKVMKKARNTALTNVIAYNTGLSLHENAPINYIVRSIVSKIYNVKLHEICTIDADAFDAELRQKINKINELINASLLKREKEIDELKF